MTKVETTLKDDTRRALELFDPLPLRERLFVRARLFSAPLETVAEATPSGKVADVGCGHGLLTALLAVTGTRQVTAVDPDSRKITWAKAGPGRLVNVTCTVGTLDHLLSRHENKFDAVVVADVLYLLPVTGWPEFLRTAWRLLKPGGILVLKEAEDNGSWKALKCLVQEKVMVRVLHRTVSSGGLQFRPRRETENILRAEGFVLLETRPIDVGYATPHVLFRAQRPIG